MADLPYIQQRQEISITGQDSVGDQVNYVGADANGNLLTKDYSDGPVTPGTAASTSLLTGGQYNTTLPTLTNTQQAALQVDSSGRLITNTTLGAGKNYIGQVGFNPGTQDVFGTLTSGSRQLQINVQFNQGILAQLVQTVFNGSATASINVNGSAQFSTGTTAGSDSSGISITTTQYASGCEVYAEFTAAFTTPVAGTYQKIGLYNATGGLYVGFIGTNFGVTVRSNSVDTTVNQSSFNLDTLTGASGSLFTNNGTPVAINFNFLNVFRIRFGWLGAAPIYYEVLSPDGNWVTFHIVRQPNSSVVPSIENPNLPMTIDVSNGATTSNMTMTTACWGAGIVSSNALQDLISYGLLTSTSGNVTLAGLNGVGSINVDVGGTFVGSLSVVASYQLNGKSLYLQNLSTNAVQTTITAPGNYRVVGVPNTGQVAVQFTSYTSGTAEISIKSTPSATYFTTPISLNASNMMVTSYLNDGSGNSISSTSGSLNTATTANVTDSDKTITGTITALNGTVVIATNGTSTVNASVSGTWVGTLVMEGTTGDSIWYMLAVGNPNGGQNVTSFTTNNLYSVGPGGFTQVRVRASAYTSGTVNVTMDASAGSSQTLAVDANGNQQIVGPSASGTAVSGNPLLLGASDGTNVQTLRANPVNNGVESLLVQNNENLRQTYSVGVGGTTFPTIASGATDVFILNGSASKTIRIINISFSITATTAVIIPVQLIKRSTANAGGTVGVATITPHDSNNATATATNLFYTANATTLGNQVGSVIRSANILANTATTISEQVLSWSFGQDGGQPIVLRGAAQGLAVNLNGTAIAGGKIALSCTWTEDNS